MGRTLILELPMRDSERGARLYLQIGQLKPVNMVAVRHRARCGKGKDVSDMREVDKPVHRLKSHRAALGAP